MASHPPVDLDAYCARIGHDGSRAPTLATLGALLERHAAAIPFEAIDVLLGRGVDLAPAALEAKLIGRRRGGYCFEQNGLFKRVLRALGFEVEGLAARVRWMMPPHAPPGPRTHMALRVALAGEAWLVDVGFGSCVPTSPLRLRDREPQQTRHGAFRLTPDGGGLLLEAHIGGEWAPVYRLYAEPQLDVDYEAPNWLTSTHPRSLFRNELLVARTTPEARLALLGNRLTIRGADGVVDRRLLTAGQVADCLAGTFGLPVEDDWLPRIREVVSRGDMGGDMGRGMAGRVSRAGTGRPTPQTRAM
ncbi:arylamine N-acetyltransferase [Arenibaculum sp.]|jgi:N-hydroxyarylamine O-acetyltransferase|uniref:arylamine N-acetyltransferase family protein n=1 Tax=Arenibaculum sp. TaxID=2865862 RepID=UPI002E1551DA|nr:arylamine N-acetyltransferase [Arenibaculum sp.]